MALLFSMARVGSYSGRHLAALGRGRSTPAAGSPPLVLAAVLTGVSLVAAIVYLRSTGAASPRRAETAARAATDGSTGAILTRFDRSFWYIMALNVLFASVFFPFRSTFAIVFFQDAKHLSLAAGRADEFLGVLRRHLRHAGVRPARRPLRPAAPCCSPSAPR